MIDDFMKGKSIIIVDVKDFHYQILQLDTDFNSLGYLVHATFNIF